MNKRKKLLSFLLVLCMIFGLTCNAYAIEINTKPTDGTTTGEPFDKGTGGSNSFRIPSLVTLSDGTLVAAADARWDTTYDGGGLDTIVSRSENNGATWNYTFANYLGDNGNAYNGQGSTCFIDPSLAVTKDDTIYMLADLYPYGVALNGSVGTYPVTKKGFDNNGNLLLSADNHQSYGYYLNMENYKIYSNGGEEQSSYTVDAHFNIKSADGSVDTNLFFSDSPFKVVRTGFLYLITSDDKGATWSEPRLLDLKRADELVCLVAPGRGLVTSSGMIVFPVYSFREDPRNSTATNAQRMGFIYSEDGGKSWQRSEHFDYSWASESVAIELKDGTLRFFFRNGSSRLCYVDYDLTKNVWGTAVTTNLATNSNCQISAITYSKTTLDGKQVIFLSCPTGPNEAGSNQSGASYRLNGKIFMGVINDNKTISWQSEKTIDVNSTHRNDQNFFMYSCLTEMSDGKIAILYEDNENGWGTGADKYYEMSYATYSVDVDFEIDGEEPVPENPADDSRDIPVEALKATAGNEEELSASNKTEGSAAFVLDNNTSTLWHTEWDGWSNRADHWIQFEVEDGYEVDGLRYLPRSNAGGDNAFGVITKYQILVSNDGQEWTKVTEGSWINNAEWKLASFEAQDVKYVRLMSIESVSDNRVFSSAAEIRLTGEEAVIIVTPQPTETEVPQPTETQAPQPTETQAPQPTETEAPQPTETPEVGEDVITVFDDVYTDWYTEYVQYVYDKNLMTGIKGTKNFEPNSNITKAQVAQVLYNMEGQPEVTDKSVFTKLKDVYEAEWYANAVAWAFNTGVVTGDLNTKEFSPNANVTREQLALMMYRYAKYKEFDTSASSDLEGLANAENTADWALAGVKWAVGSGLISGLDKGDVKDLAPQGNASRAQMAAILQRFCENIK